MAVQGKGTASSKPITGSSSLAGAGLALYVGITP